MNGYKKAHASTVIYVINKHEHVFRLRIVAMYGLHSEYDSLNF